MQKIRKYPHQCKPSLNIMILACGMKLMKSIIQFVISEYHFRLPSTINL